MRVEFQIAQRLFQQRDSTKRLSRPAIAIAQWGVAVGIAVMILSISIVIGFKNQIRDKVMGFGTHIQLINYKTMYANESQPIQVDSLLLQQVQDVENVAHVQRFAIKSCMLKTDCAFKGVMLKGIAADYDTTFLSQHLIAGELPHFSDTLSSQSIVISSKIAKQLQLQVGQRIFAYFFSQNVKARRYTIAAIYETHLSDFDDLIIYTDLKAVQQLAGWESDQCSGVEIQVENLNQLQTTTSELILLYNRTEDAYGNPYAVFHIYELYPSIFSWLQLLNTNVYIILILMLGLSLFTMISGLLIIILERTQFIAIMKSLGATTLQLRRVFLYFASFLVGRGLIFGNIIGIALCLLQKYAHIIKLDAEIYYLDSVPVELSLNYILLINIFSLLISLLVLLIPTRLISRIHPAKVMRYE